MHCAFYAVLGLKPSSVVGCPVEYKAHQLVATLSLNPGTHEGCPIVPERHLQGAMLSLKPSSVDGFYVGHDPFVAFHFA